MKLLSKRGAAIALAAATLALVAAEPAMAQVVGGGGGGAFTSVYSWFMSNIWAGIVLLGIVCVGFMFWFGKAAVWIIGLGAIGGLIVKFAPDIQRFFV